MKGILHKIVHLFGWNYGEVYSYWEGEKLMMSFKCYGCGKLSHIHEVTETIEELCDLAKENWKEPKFYPSI